jgi:hypothetical protein
MMRAEQKIAQARSIKSELGARFKVRRGKAYVFCQCRKCLRVFQVPYGFPGAWFALKILRDHPDYCRQAKAVASTST